MSDRDRFLAALRGRLAAGAHESLPHPLVDVAEVPLPVFATAAAGPLDALRASVERSGATLHEGSMESVLAGVVELHAVRSAVVSADAEVTGAAAVLAGLGVAVTPFDGPLCARDADLGVVGCRWAVASTGSLVLDAARAGGRTASLVPPVVLAFVDRARVLPDLSALLREMGRHCPDGPPSQLVLHTGPSRSGDIEGVLTRGVHGPGTVHVGLLPSA